MDPQHYSPEQIARRARSEAILASHNIQVGAELPDIAGETNTPVRSPDELAERALALCYVALKGEGLEYDFLKTFDKRYNARARLSPEEEHFAADKRPLPADLIHYKWRYESLQVLLWALGLVDSLPYPGHICEVPLLMDAILNSGDEAAFKAGVNPRSMDALLDEADLTCLLYRTCEDDAAPAPGNVDAGIVYERHYAFQWLIHSGQEWDDVILD